MHTRILALGRFERIVHVRSDGKAMAGHVLAADEEVILSPRSARIGRVQLAAFAIFERPPGSSTECDKGIKLAGRRGWQR